MRKGSTPLTGRLIAGLPVVTAAQEAVLADLHLWAEDIVTADTGFDAADLARMLVHSHHLQSLARRHSDVILAILRGDAATVVHDAISEFEAEAYALFEAGDDAKMMRAIRRLRQRTALAVALGDLAATATIADQMEWLSRAADRAVDATARYLLWQASHRNLMPPPQEDLAGCGWSILALGKLGAGELNYSSDIDLIVLHDPEATSLFAPEKAQSFYVEMTRSFVKLLSHNSSDGIGWRVDLRLRPDPGATAVSIQREAALGYYESIARTWERAAFIRARPVGGDRQFGADFLKELQPFVWRRTLDYTVMDDMKMMLRRPRHGNGWAGFNLKTGENGIRNIEFLTHVLQLVAGGRNRDIRCGSTLPALAALAAHDWISPAQADALPGLYLDLRQIEHRLQMLADAQTHSLPRGDEELEKYAQFLGWSDASAFLEQLGACLADIGTHASHRIFADEATETADDHPGATMTPTAHDGERPMLEDEEQLAGWLQAHNFARPQDVVATISGWMAGRIAATRSERARALLDRLAPVILTQLSNASNPDEAFAALAQFIEGLPASVQIFSLLDHNRHLTTLLCDMLILSPRMALYLRHYPALFDLVLFDGFFSPLPPHDEMKATLQSATASLDVEQALQTIQRLAREWRFQIEAQALSGVANEAALGDGLSMIADIVIEAVLGLARRDMERRHGRIEGAIAIIGLGRLGVRELTAQSDLDLVAVFDTPAAGDHLRVSDGARPLPATSYFTRLIQTFINWMGMADVAGRFNEIDMRLRPDGDKGNIAVHSQRFSDYFTNEAWLWERLAMAKARIVACDNGPTVDDGRTATTGLAPTLNRLIADTAIRNDNGTSITADAVATAVGEMRDRLRTTYQNASALQLRRQPGGLGELDLLVQGLRLQHAALFDGSGQNAVTIIERLRDAEVLAATDASDLLQAVTLFSRLHHYLRLCLGSANRMPDELPDAVWRFLLRQLDMPDADYLLAELGNARQRVDAIFDAVFTTKIDG